MITKALILLHLYWSFMDMSNKKWFTLIELIIAIALFGIGLIAVFVVLNSGFNTMSQARGQVTAINLAREGVEMMFNLRDSNLLRWSGKWDLCWLNHNSPVNFSLDTCEDAGWVSAMQPWQAIKLTPRSNGYIFAETFNFYALFKLDIFNPSGPNVMNRLFSMCLNTVTNQWEQCVLDNVAETVCYTFDENTETWGDVACSSLNLTTVAQAGRYYRSITSQGLYDKTSTSTGWNLMNCSEGNTTDTLWWGYCWSSKAKEFRFCSEVQYIVNKAKRKVTMCSLITNFQE